MSLFTILVVEDNEAEALLLQRAFKKLALPVSIQCVVNGDEAIEYLSGEDPFSNREDYPEPDLVIMDLKMPAKGGLEVLSWFRNLEEAAMIPIILLTGSCNEADVQKAYVLGANSYFVKPASFEELRGMVKTIHDYWSLARRPKSVVARV